MFELSGHDSGKAPGQLLVHGLTWVGTTIGGPGATPSGTLIVGVSDCGTLLPWPGVGGGTWIGGGNSKDGRPERGRSGDELTALFSSWVACRISSVMRAASSAVPTTFGVMPGISAFTITAGPEPIRYTSRVLPSNVNVVLSKPANTSVPMGPAK